LTLTPVIVDETKIALRRMEMCEYERLKVRSQDAWDEYVEAKSAMFELMRRTRVDSQAWAEHKTRLEQAIDRRVAIQRAYWR